MAGCCTSGASGNTGVPNGVKPFGATNSVLLVPLTDSEGNRNGIDLTTDLGAQILAMLNQQDPSKRLYPYVNLDLYDEVEADATTTDNRRGLSTINRRGVRSVTFEMWGKNEQFYEKTLPNCQEYGVYKIDECGNLQGAKEGTTLYPIDTYAPSRHSVFLDKKDDTPSIIRYTFQFSNVESTVNNRWMITADEIGFNPNMAKGMQDVVISVVKDDATDMTLTIKFGYGTAVDLKPTAGLITADIKVLDETGSAEVITVTGGTDGIYVATMTAVPDIGTVNVYKSGATTMTSGKIGSQTFDFS